MKKVLLLSVIALFLGMNANAQIGESKSRKIESKARKGYGFLDLNVGGVHEVGGFGVDLGYYRTMFEKSDWELAWDVIRFEFSAPFDSPADYDQLSLKTGFRVFTPSFFNGKWRLFTNLDLGYTCVLASFGGYSFGSYDFDEEDYDLGNYSDLISWASSFTKADYDYYDSDDISAYHGFGLTWGIGLQYNKRFSIGYTLQYESKFETKNHFGTIQFTF